MLCPLCKIPLQASEHLSIEVNHCSQCSGKWLDNGVLEIIIEQNISIGKFEKNKLEKQAIVDKAKIENAQHLHEKPRKHPHFLSGAFDVSDDW